MVSSLIFDCWMILNMIFNYSHCTVSAKRHWSSVNVGRFLLLHIFFLYDHIHQQHSFTNQDGEMAMAAEKLREEGG